MPFKTTAILTAAVMLSLGLVLMFVPLMVFDDVFDVLSTAPHTIARRVSMFMFFYAFLLFRLHDLPPGKPRAALCQGSIFLMFGLGGLAIFEYAMGHASESFLRIGAANFAIGGLFVWSCFYERSRG